MRSLPPRGLYLTHKRQSQQSLWLQVLCLVFTAPERHRGTDTDSMEPASATADCWSLGVLLFLLLTGELPFVLCTELKVRVPHLDRAMLLCCCCASQLLDWPCWCQQLSTRFGCDTSD